MNIVFIFVSKNYLLLIYILTLLISLRLLAKRGVTLRIKFVTKLL